MSASISPNAQKHGKYFRARATRQRSNLSWALLPQSAYHAKAQRDNEREKASVATNIDIADGPSVASKDDVLFVRLSEIETMIDEAFMESDKSKDYLMAELDKKTVVETM